MDEFEFGRLFGACALSVTRRALCTRMSEAADARGGGHLDASERIKVIGRFRPLEPGAEAAQWLIDGTTLTYAIARTQIP